MTSGTEIHVNDIFRSNPAQQQEHILGEYLQFVQQNYSREMYVLVHSLLSPATPSSIQDVAASVAMRAFDELDSAHESIDGQCTALMGIYESGRALRLLLKLAFVNERPEFGIDKNWSESGDCYILKLFRDFGERKWLIVRALLYFCCSVSTVIHYPRICLLLLLHVGLFVCSLSSG